MENAKVVVRGRDLSVKGVLLPSDIALNSAKKARGFACTGLGSPFASTCKPRVYFSPIVKISRVRKIPSSLLSAKKPGEGDHA
jgi:hypothetical protein